MNALHAAGAGAALGTCALTCTQLGNRGDQRVGRYLIELDREVPATLLGFAFRVTGGNIGRPRPSRSRAVPCHGQALEASSVLTGHSGRPLRRRREGAGRARRSRRFPSGIDTELVVGQWVVVRRGSGSEARFLSSVGQAADIEGASQPINLWPLTSQVSPPTRNERGPHPKLLGEAT